MTGSSAPSGSLPGPDAGRSTGRPKVVVSWSSGKDSAFALGELLRGGEVEVVGLLTTITETFNRVSMHGVRESILEAQAAAMGLPLYKVQIPFPCPNSVYEARMAEVTRQLREQSVTHVAFGDLFLQDVRAYREEKMRSSGLAPLFPIWGRPTRALALEMIDQGLDATLVCVDPRKIPGTLAGRRFDRSLLADLPADADPCGEHGEFHTCVTAAPFFAHPIRVRPGPVVARDGLVFADLELE
ncbi:MAG: Dph6-related ATP pyrophosphatase [Thermoplasmata archaeon]